MMNDRRSLLATILVAGLFACAKSTVGGRAAAPAPNKFPADCVAAGPPGARRDSIRVIEDAPVSSQDAPVPRSGAERVAFALAYETLVSSDCQGSVRPGVAQAWSRDGGGWRFVLREDARFWDGAPVLAADVLAAWRQRDSSLAARATADGPGVILVTGDDALDVVTQASAAVTKPAPDRGWPIGTGSRWITGGSSDADAVVQPTAPGAAPGITFARGTEDARDALESHADVVITDDRAALAYAGTRPRFAVLPLEWSTVYVLVAPDQVSVDRKDLVAAVRVDAAPAEGPACGPNMSRAARPSGPRRVAYRQGDPTAEAVAARLIGSGAVGRGAFAVALRTADWTRAVEQGTEWAVLVPRPAHAACSATSTWGWATPLIAVRSSVVVDRSLLPLRLGPGGAPRLGDPR
jgi:hypothetical protein